MRRRVFPATLAAMALPALALASGTAMSPVVSAKLAGKSEVPKGDPDGSGIAIFHLSTTKRTVCWSFDNLKRIGPPVVSHIHKGRVGAAGPVVVPLGAQYKPKGCVAAAKPVIEAIETHPNAYYVNIHDAKYPNGAIRGQLAAGMLGR